MSKLPLSRAKLCEAMDARDIEALRYYAGVVRAVEGQNMTTRLKICELMGIDIRGLIDLGVTNTDRSRIAEILGVKSFLHISPAPHKAHETKYRQAMKEKAGLISAAIAGKDFVARFEPLREEKFFFGSSKKSMNPRYLEYLAKHFAECPTEEVQLAFLRDQNVNTKANRQKIRAEVERQKRQNRGKLSA